MRTVWIPLALLVTACSEPDAPDPPTLPTDPPLDTGTDVALAPVRMRLPLRQLGLGAEQVFFLDPGAAADPNVRAFLVAQSQTSAITDDLVHGVPVVSPVDGELLTCWSGYPDAPDADDSRVLPEGNHVRVLTDDGVVVLLGQLQPGSLCPDNGAGSHPLDLGRRVGDWPEEIVVDGERPRITQGAVVGLAGRSGAPGPARVHLEARRYLGGYRVSATVPIELGYAWFKLEHTDWQPLRGQTLGEAPTWILASPFRPLSRVHGEPVAIAGAHVAGRIVAYSDADRDVNVVAVDLVGDQLALGDGASGAEGDSVRAVPIDGVPGVVTYSNLGPSRLDSWQLTPDIAAVWAATDVSTVRAEVTPFPWGPGLFVALRDADDRLRVRAWDVDPQSLRITPADVAVAGRIEDVAVAATAARGTSAVTATTDAQHQLKLIVWPYDAREGTFGDRSDDVVAGDDIGGTTLIRAPLDDVDLFVSASLGGQPLSHTLQLTVWEVDAAGRIERRATRRFEDIRIFLPAHFAAASDGHVLLGVRDLDHAARVLAFRVTREGDIALVGSLAEAPATALAPSWFVDGGREIVLTVGDDPDLRVTAYEANLR